MCIWNKTRISSSYKSSLYISTFMGTGVSNWVSPVTGTVWQGKGAQGLHCWHMCLITTEFRGDRMYTDDVMNSLGRHSRWCSVYSLVPRPSITAVIEGLGTRLFSLIMPSSGCTEHKMPFIWSLTSFATRHSCLYSTVYKLCGSHVYSVVQVLSLLV